jgi:hypothetical protein
VRSPDHDPTAVIPRQPSGTGTFPAVSDRVPIKIPHDPDFTPRRKPSSARYWAAVAAWLCVYATLAEWAWLLAKAAFWLWG